MKRLRELFEIRRCVGILQLQRVADDGFERGRAAFGSGPHDEAREQSRPVERLLCDANVHDQIARRRGGARHERRQASLHARALLRRERLKRAWRGERDARALEETLGPRGFGHGREPRVGRRGDRIDAEEREGLLAHAQRPFENGRDLPAGAAQADVEILREEPAVWRDEALRRGFVEERCGLGVARTRLGVERLDAGEERRRERKADEKRGEIAGAPAPVGEQREQRLEELPHGEAKTEEAITPCSSRA